MWGNVRAGALLAFLQKATLLVCILGSGALLGFLLWPEPEAHAALPVRVKVAGHEVETHADPAASAELLAHRYLEGKLTLAAEGHARTLPRAALGVRVDTEHLTALLAQAADPRSPLRRLHAQLDRTGPLHLPMPAYVDEQRASALLIALKDLVDQAPLEPRVDARKGVVVPAKPGYELDVYGSLERLELSARSGEGRVEVALRALPPKRTQAAFDHLDMRAVLGEFETRYTRSNTSADRTHNLRLVAAKIDGYVLEPGAVFDFNAVVGPRTPVNGFKSAPVIADGELALGMGGGTCQIASTLHAAAYFAGMPILSRHPHSRPSFYIKLGLDATVVDGAQNFRFRNDRSYPVVIAASVSDGRVHVSLHGPRRDRTVTFIRHIHTVTPFEERFVQDPSLPSGLRVLSQRGVPGFKISRFRIIENHDTNVAVREHEEDGYPPTAQLWRIGSGGPTPPGFSRPPNDPHLEYVADEYLRLTQLPSGDFEVVKEPGRTGSYGWTEREQMVRR